MKLPSVLTTFSTRFTSSEEGSVLMLFGLGAAMLFAVGGAGIDLGHQQLTKLRLQQSADAASIAAATISSPTTTTLSTADRVNAANRYFNLNWPASSSETPPTPLVSVTATDVRVAASTTSSTAFIGPNTLNAAGASAVKIATSIPPDYDLVIAVDESRSMGDAMVNSNAVHPGPSTRMGVIQSSILTLLDGILPPGVSNPNVRVGLAGAANKYYITDKWPVTSDRTDAMLYPTRLSVHDTPPDDYAALLMATNIVAGGNELIFDPSDPIPYYTHACVGGSFNSSYPGYGSAMGSCSTTTVPVGIGFGCSITCSGDPMGPVPYDLDYASYSSAASFWYSPKTATDRGPGPSFSPCSVAGMTCPGRSFTRSIVVIPAGPLDPTLCTFVTQVGQLFGASAIATLYVINIGLTDPATIDNLKSCASVDPLTHQPLYYEAPDEATLQGIFHNIAVTLGSIHISE